MPERPHLAHHDVEILRRSLVAGGLPTASVEWLLDEAGLLLIERDAIRTALAELGRPWGDVRAVLNELHRLAAHDP